MKKIFILSLAALSMSFAVNAQEEAKQDEL